MLGLTLREEFRSKRLKGTAIGLEPVDFFCLRIT